MARRTLGCAALAIGLVFGLSPPSSGSDTKPVVRPDVGTGRVAWFDISTTDLARAKDFYGKLLGWTFSPVIGTEYAVHIDSGGATIGTLRSAEGKISQFNGVVYIQVPDIQESCEKAKALGGTLVDGFPFNLPDGSGAIGLVVDPLGHPVGLFSHRPLPATK